MKWKGKERRKGPRLRTSKGDPWIWTPEQRKRFYSMEKKYEGRVIRFRRECARFKPLQLDQLRALPKADYDTHDCGIYFLWWGPILIYVGKSNQIGARLFKHRETKRFTHATYERFEEEEAAKQNEREYVMKYSPQLNQTWWG